MEKCHKCGNKTVIKNGFCNNIQRWKCKNCNYKSIREIPRGYDLSSKLLAVSLCLNGVSKNMVSKILGVSCQTIVRWVREIESTFGRLPEPTSNATTLRTEHTIKFKSPSILLYFKEAYSK